MKNSELKQIDTVEAAQSIGVVHPDEPVVLSEEDSIALDTLIASQKKHLPLYEAPEELVHEIVREEMTITLRPSSRYTPPGLVFVGVGDIKARYLAWLKKSYDDALSDKKESPAVKQAKKHFIHGLCFMAMCEEQVRHLTYKYDGPPLHRRFDFVTPLQEFVKENKALLKLIAPYYGVRPLEKLEETTD